MRGGSQVHDEMHNFERQITPNPVHLHYSTVQYITVQHGTVESDAYIQDKGIKVLHNNKHFLNLKISEKSSSM